MECNLPYRERGCIGCSESECLEDLPDLCECCDNPQMGFDCSCEHSDKHPGEIEYGCEFCGIYWASEPKCNKCETD